VPPLHRNHFVTGPYTLKGGRLTFRADQQTTYYAQQARDADADFTVCLSGRDGLKEMTGKILSVELIKGMKPAQWEITIVVTR
jgi:hypothetical protein